MTITFPCSADSNAQPLPRLEVTAPTDLVAAAVPRKRRRKGAGSTGDNGICVLLLGSDSPSSRPATRRGFARAEAAAVSMQWYVVEPGATGIRCVG